MSQQSLPQKPGNPHWRLECIPLLSPEECDRACNAVLNDRNNWRRRHPVSEFYTVGVASYLDAGNGRFAEYREQAQSSNSLLYKQFECLYQRLASAMCAFTGESCFYDDELAYPGFHIFLGNDSHELSASRHYDLQYRNIDWTRYERPDIGLNLSFTLALRLPHFGGGLYMWNINEDDLHRFPQQDRREYLHRNRRPTYHKYETGALIIHNGRYLHQIARVRQMRAGDQRITMQGHSLRTEKGWVLYW